MQRRHNHRCRYLRALLLITQTDEQCAARCVVAIHQHVIPVEQIFDPGLEGNGFVHLITRIQIKHAIARQSDRCKRADVDILPRAAILHFAARFPGADLLLYGNIGKLLYTAQQHLARSRITRILPCRIGAQVDIAKLTGIAQFLAIDARPVYIDHRGKSAVTGYQIADSVVEICCFETLLICRIAQADLVILRTFRAQIRVGITRVIQIIEGRRLECIADTRCCAKSE